MEQSISVQESLKNNKKEADLERLVDNLFQQEDRTELTPAAKLSDALNRVAEQLEWRNSFSPHAVKALQAGKSLFLEPI